MAAVVSEEILILADISVKIESRNSLSQLLTRLAVCFANAFGELPEINSRKFVAVLLRLDTLLEQLSSEFFLGILIGVTVRG